MKFLLRREDTGKVARLELEEDQQVFDLLETSLSLLKFDEDAVLGVYPEGKDNLFSEATLLSDLKDIPILIVKDKGIETKAKMKAMEEAKTRDEEAKMKAKEEAKTRDKENMETKIKSKEETTAKNKENMASAEKIVNNTASAINHDDKLKDDSETFSNKFATRKPNESSTQKTLLDGLKTKTQENSTAGSSMECSEDEEIKILTKKIKSESLDGFMYEIFPEDYTNHNESTYMEYSFSSEQERSATQSKVSSTNDWSSWNAEAGFSGWGVSISASAGQKKSSSEHEGNKFEKKQKTNIAIVTRTSFHQMKKFRVRVRLDKKAVEEAKKILKVQMFDKRQAIAAFNEKYCSFVYTGQFSAGGWFRTVATAKSTEALEFTALEREASARTETHWAVGASAPLSTSGCGMNAGGGQNTGSGNSTSSQESQQSTNSSIQVTIRKESAPGNTTSENDLESKIKDAKNWTVFPIAGAKKADYIQVFEIMKNQAEETEDRELGKVSYIMKMYMKGMTARMGDIQSPPYVVLLGDVGTGKSTVVEKLTGEMGRSSEANESVTKTSEPFWVPDGSLIISDTPGSNAMKEKLEHNVWIASALNFRPVSRIFIIVKAETRFDNVVDNVRKYDNRFLDLPMDVVGVLVTHMDTIGWEREDFIAVLNDELGIETVVFSSLTTPADVLLHDIHKVCTERHNLTIDHENFFKLFKIHNNHRKILQCTQREVKDFEDLKKNFDEARKAFKGNDLVDLIFEFQAWMGEEIIKAKQRMAEDNDFTFLGDGAANEAGHVANMTNQLRMILFDIRTEALLFQSEHGVSELRKCPFCGLIWNKIEGCDGSTTCGSRPTTKHDLRDSSFEVLGTFTFFWSKKSKQLDISKTGTKSIQEPKSSNTTKPPPGCGKAINWTDMAKVSVPSEFSKSKKVGTEDVNVLPNEASGFVEKLGGMIKNVGSKMTLGGRPTSTEKP